MDRRQFLRTAGLGVIGLAGTAALGGCAAESSDNAAGAAEPKDRVLHSFRRDGRKVEIVEMPNGMPMMQIDGRMLSHETFARTERGYGSHLLPFQDFSNPLDIAKQLLDNDGLLFKL
jgi:hypothetical protein